MAALKEWMYQLIAFIARVHDNIVNFNKGISSPYTDTELHFIVIGLFGLLLFLLVVPVFRFLTRRGRYGLISWLFTFSTVLFVILAIEVGQYLTKTGSLQTRDIAYGIAGFLAASAVIAPVYLLARLIRRFFSNEK